MYFSLIALKSRPEERVRSQMGAWLWLHPWQAYASPVTKLFSLVCPAAQRMQDIFISPLFISAINLSPLYFIQAVLNIRYALIDCSALKCLRWGDLQEKCDDFVTSCAETQVLLVLERMLWVLNCLRCTPRVVDISCNCWSYPFSDLLFFSGAWVWSRPWRKTMRWTWSTSQSA